MNRGGAGRAHRVPVTTTDTIATPDWAGAFAMTIGDVGTPEQWARAAFDDAPRALRRGARAVWSAAAPVHRLTEPYLLRHAASHPGADQ
jgi:hypothetical protein